MTQQFTSANSKSSTGVHPVRQSNFKIGWASTHDNRTMKQHMQDDPIKNHQNKIDKEPWRNKKNDSNVHLQDVTVAGSTDTSAALAYLRPQTAQRSASQWN